MAVPQIQFCTPPTFHGKDDEDGVDWLQRYEAAGRFNNWGVGELFTNFERYSEGACRLWYQCLAPAPTQWEDTEEILAANNGGVRVPPSNQVKTLFQRAFQQQNYALYQEQKLREKKQERDESATTYYYEVMSLCRKVDPNMAELTKLNYLYKGLNRALLRQIYPLQPVSCNDFLTKVKVFTTTELLANQQYSKEKVVRDLAEKLHQTDNSAINWLKAENLRKDEELKKLHKIQQQKDGVTMSVIRHDTSKEVEKDSAWAQQFKQLQLDVETMKNTAANKGQGGNPNRQRGRGSQNNQGFQNDQRSQYKNLLYDLTSSLK